MIRIGIVSANASPNSLLAHELVHEYLIGQLAEGWELVEAVIEGASQSEAEAHLHQWIDVDGLLLVFVLGSNGPVSSFSDATLAVCPKLFAGFGEQIRRLLLPINPLASAFRLVTGIRRQSLVVNLPDEPELLSVCLPALFPAIPNAVFLASGVRIRK